MSTAIEHNGPRTPRVHRLARQLAQCRERAEAARFYGDETGARIAKADARRIARILAEG